ncbi:hypothetical protein AB9K35_16600 [Leisingera sp. XS_AS12]|uniref:hypothetical protein n=1 Tax=Leisingera sp. XS_AS12 TaxID=3241294 RepID=UPI00351111AD
MRGSKLISLVVSAAAVVAFMAVACAVYLAIYISNTIILAAVSYSHDLMGTSLKSNSLSVLLPLFLVMLGAYGIVRLRSNTYEDLKQDSKARERERLEAVRERRAKQEDFLQEMRGQLRAWRRRHGIAPHIETRLLFVRVMDPKVGQPRLRPVVQAMVDGKSIDLEADRSDLREACQRIEMDLIPNTSFLSDSIIMKG